MKKIEAIVRLSRFDKIRDELANIGIRFFTMKEVNGFGLQASEKRTYRGSIYDTDYIARLQLDILTEEDRVDEIVAVIAKAAHTGNEGDGKISVHSIEKVLRIRTGETGSDAI